MIQVFFYTDIPGAVKNWTLAVFATGRRDADNYIKTACHGGRYVGKEDRPGAKIKAHCGATTEAASMEIREKTNDHEKRTH